MFCCGMGTDGSKLDAEDPPGPRGLRRPLPGGQEHLDGLHRPSIDNGTENQLPYPVRCDGACSNYISRRGSKSEGNEYDQGAFFSSQAALSLGSSPVLETTWTPSSLLDLTNSVRLSLAQEKHFGPDANKLAPFLEAAYSDEIRDISTLGFETIKQTHLDKLLHDIIEFAKRPSALSTKDLSAIANATSLQRLWRSRLRARYFTIDEIRAHEMVTSGRLKGVTLSLPESRDVPALYVWRPSQVDAMSDFETNLQFDAGKWWLNIACAYRDGIVGNEYEKPTEGQYGITALPLLTGREALLEPNRVKYIREGKLSDMHNSLVTQTGKQIRILRGYRLKSIYAPSAGVRYDGLWRLASYRQKLDEEVGAYRLELTIERVDGQVSMEAVTRIPQPSQLDDWWLYKKLEAEKIRRTEGEGRLLES